MRPSAALAATVLFLAAACSSRTEPAASTPTPPPISSATPMTIATATVAPSMTPSPLAAATSTPVARIEPLGLPIAPRTRLGLVTGAPPQRTIAWGAGPAAEDYSRLDQAGSEAVAANRSGWNCRVHQEYEGQAAVDWYISVGTPVHATMDGTAHLYVATVSNPFEVYGLDREPYIGNPDRARAPLSPFPGPGGGKGVFVRVDNPGFVTEYAHLDVATFQAVPPAAFLPGYAAGTGLAERFRELRDFQTFDEVATWQVRAGDLVGISGDTGYSEAPHLHYTVRRQGGPLLCPTAEAGFNDGGWLFR